MLMAMPNRPPSAQDKVAQYVFLGVVQEALNLARRFQEGEGFRAYVLTRMWLVAPIGLLMILTSIGCAAATVQIGRAHV